MTMLKLTLTKLEGLIKALKEVIKASLVPHKNHLRSK